MYDKRSEKKAERLGILDKLRALDSDLLQVEGISGIEYDLDGYADLGQVILIPRYDAGKLDDGYYRRRSQQLVKILSVCSLHGLRPSGDTIEDYGEHWYIVRDTDNTWPLVKAQQA